MDTDLLTLVEQDGFRATRRPSTSRGGQYNGPCPWCNGTDRFRVQPNYGTYGWFACSQCGKKGNAIDYLMLKRNFSKREALAAVGWIPKEARTEVSPPPIPATAYHERPQWNAPPQQWQEGARNFARECQRILWSEQGEHALEYLRNRRLSDEIIKAAMLGYHPHANPGTAREWGRAVWLPQGIVIPWLFERYTWRITIRNEAIAYGQGRYMQVAGGSNGLYLADILKKRKRPHVVLVEGELDALSIFQTCRDLVHVVATGTTQGGHIPRWVSLLAQQEQVFVAFDAEDKGDLAAQWWLSRLPNARRLRPWWRDANQMLQDGADLRDWLRTGIEETQRLPGPVGASSAQSTLIQEQSPQIAPSLQAVEPKATIDEGELAEICAVCALSIYQDDNNEFRFSPEGVLYCGTHYQTHVQSREDRHQRFLTTVARLASIFPGGCAITVDPPTYTLAQRVQEFQAEKCAKEQARYEAMMQARWNRWVSKLEK